MREKLNKNYLENTKLTEKEMEAMHFLIGSIDDKGFLTSDIADIAEMGVMEITVALECKFVYFPMFTEQINLCHV